jgi:flagellar FliL protein
MADDKEGIGPEAENQPPTASDAQEKASIDTGTVTAPSNRSLQKVELDLDDAVFLDDEDEIEEPPAEPEKKEPVEEDKQPSFFWKYKKFFLAAIALLLVGSALFWWLFVKPEPLVTPPEPAQENQAVSEPPEKESPELTEHVMAFEPFWLEFEVNGTYRFLTCRFTFPVEGDLLRTEVDTKRIIIRDAVYYYFKNKDIVFLGNTDNGDKLKTDLLEIINQYLGNGQLEEILIQEYRVE